MKNLMKISAAAAAILTLATVGVSSAQAEGRPVARGFSGGFVVGRTAAWCSPVRYYSPRVYVAPVCVPVPVVVRTAPVFCAPGYYPPVRFGAYVVPPRCFRRW